MQGQAARARCAMEIPGSPEYFEREVNDDDISLVPSSFRKRMNRGLEVPEFVGADEAIPVSFIGSPGGTEGTPYIVSPKGLYNRQKSAFSDGERADTKPYSFAFTFPSLVGQTVISKQAVLLTQLPRISCLPSFPVTYRRRSALQWRDRDGFAPFFPIKPFRAPAQYSFDVLSVAPLFLAVNEFLNFSCKKYEVCPISI